MVASEALIEGTATPEIWAGAVTVRVDRTSLAEL